MKTLYFKVKIGYKEEENIPITKDELEKALYAFSTKDDVIFQNGACQGKSIISILPDYHRTMGWNQGYKLMPEDYEYMQKQIVNPIKYIAQAKSNVDFYINTKQEHLIGSEPLEIKQIDKPKDDPRLGGAKQIGDLI